MRVPDLGAIVSPRLKTPPPIVLPRLDWKPTSAQGSRDGQAVVRVVLHRWGVTFTNLAAEARSYGGVINEFENSANQASAHVVMPGSAVLGRATQMIPWSQKAWTEEAYNPSSVEIECADAIWLGDDPHGLQVTARMTAFLLHKYGLPPRWSAEHGFCRHADLGVAGGDHLACPTVSMPVWKAFSHLVLFEATRGDFLPTWGRN